MEKFSVEFFTLARTKDGMRGEFVLKGDFSTCMSLIENFLKEIAKKQESENVVS